MTAAVPPPSDAEARLAAALRANLRRRKRVATERPDPADRPSPEKSD